jgi:hypothetical protein
MAITIHEQPPWPNVTKTNLVFNVSSDKSNEPQMRYVFDIHGYFSNEFFGRVKVYPNKEGRGIVDLSRELDDLVSYQPSWKQVGTGYNTGQIILNIKIGEQYSTSLSEPSTIYPALFQIIQYVWPGTVYKSNGVGYDYPTNAEPLLTNRPDNIEMSEDDYVTFSTVRAAAIANGAIVTYRNSAGTIISTVNYFVGQGVYQYGIGKGNAPAGWDTATVEVNVPAGGTKTIVYKKLETCKDDSTSFAFINDYGVWDYYHISNPLRESTQVSRSTYDQSFVRYDDLLSSYNASNRGTTQYRTEYSDTFTITTDYLDKPTGDWLTEMFRSPEVYIQQGDDFVPINIINSDVTWNMDENRQKLFQYEIEFKYANQPQPR